MLIQNCWESKIGEKSVVVKPEEVKSEHPVKDVKTGQKEREVGCREASVCFLPPPNQI